MATNPAHLKILEKWMSGYKPEELFDKTGRLLPELKALAPKGHRRMSANPIANGGLLRKPLEMPDFRRLGVEVKKPGATLASSVPTLGNFLREVMRRNMRNFRVFGPDETESNHCKPSMKSARRSGSASTFRRMLTAQLAPNGRVMEMLSEHTVEGWLEGYILSGRHGLINSYEPFIHVIDSMFNQHAKWLEKCNEFSWRQRYRRSTVDHRPGLAAGPQWIHPSGSRIPRRGRKQEPGTCPNLPAARRQLPTVGRRPLSAERNYVNVIVADKQVHPVHGYGRGDRALHQRHRHLGLGQQRQGVEPDVVMASSGDIPTMESLAATALLRE